MKRLVSGLERIIDRISNWLAEVAAASVLLLVVVVTFSVVMRFVFNSSKNWTDELASYCLLWMVFLGLSYTLNAGVHIRIDFFTDMLPPRMQHHFEVATWAIGVVFAVLLFLGCLSAFQNFVQRGTYSTAGLDIPLFWPAIAMLLGSILFALAMLARLMRLIVLGEVAAPAHDPGGHE